MSDRDYVQRQIFFLLVLLMEELEDLVNKLCRDTAQVHLVAEIATGLWASRLNPGERPFRRIRNYSAMSLATILSLRQMLDDVVTTPLIQQVDAEIVQGGLDSSVVEAVTAGFDANVVQALTDGDALTHLVGGFVQYAGELLYALLAPTGPEPYSALVRLRLSLELVEGATGLELSKIVSEPELRALVLSALGLTGAQWGEFGANVADILLRDIEEPHRGEAAQAVTLHLRNRWDDLPHV